MQSQHSSNTPRHVLFGPVVDATTNMSPLPIINHTDLLEDLESFLDETAIFTSDTSSPSTMTVTDDEGRKKPRAIRNLGPLIDHQDDAKKTTDISHVNLGNRSNPRLRIGERIEPWLHVEVRSRGIPPKNTSDKDDEKENLAFKLTRDPPQKKRGLFTKHDKKHRRQGKQDTKSSHSPVVWVVEPTYDKSHQLRLKFTTENGACLILKAEEVLASLEIMQSRENTYFQVYSIDGTSSRVVGLEEIKLSMEEIVSESKPSLGEDDLLTTSSKAKDKGRLDRRFYRFLRRRRCNTKVRRQVRLADAGYRPAGVTGMGRPIATLWERITRRKDDAPSI
jgi:hypothetical protein